MTTTTTAPAAALATTPAEPPGGSIVLMNQDDARRAIETIKTHLDSARRTLLDLYDREGWRALGYPSWRDCAQAEFGQSVAYLYRQLTAAKIERELDSPIGEMPESHARAVAKAAPSDRPAVLTRADQLAGDSPRTAKHIEQAAAEISESELPPEYDIVKRRLAAHGIALLSNMQGHHRAYVTRKEGMTGVVTFEWANVLSKLERLEAEPVPAPDPAIELEIKRLCAISGSKYCGIATNLPYPSATRYRIAKFSGGGGDYLADEALDQLRHECDLRAATVPQPAAPPRAASATVAAYNQQEERDSGRLLRARTLIGNGEYDAARVVLGGIEVSTMARDQVLATIPAGRQITLALTFDDCAALLKEAKAFEQGGLTKRLPTIGQALVLMIEAIKGASA